MNLKTTLADLVLSAQAAATKAHDLTAAFAQQTAKLEAFTQSGFHPDDFPAWENAFHAQLEMLSAFARQPSPATAAAKLAAPPAGAAQS